MAKRSNLIVVLGLAVFVIGAAATYFIAKDDGGEHHSASGRSTVLYAAKPIPAGTSGSSAPEPGPGEEASHRRVGQAGQRPHRPDAARRARPPSCGVPEGSVLTTDQFPQAQTRIGTLKIPEGKTALAVELGQRAGRGRVRPGRRPHQHLRRAQGRPVQLPGRAQAELVMQNIEVLSVNGASLVDRRQASRGGAGLLYLLAVTPGRGRAAHLPDHLPGRSTSRSSPKDQAPVRGTPGVERWPDALKTLRKERSHAQPEDPRSGPRRRSWPAGPERRRRAPSPSRGRALRAPRARWATLLTEEGPFDVLVAGPSLGTRSGLARLRLIRDELPGMSLVLAFTRRPDASCGTSSAPAPSTCSSCRWRDKELRDTLERAVGTAPAADGGHAGRDGLRVAGGASGHAWHACSRSRRPPAAAARRSSPPTSPTSCSRYTGKRRVHRRPRPAVRRGVAPPCACGRSTRSSTRCQREDDEDGDLGAHIEEYMRHPRDRLSCWPRPEDPSEADRIDPPDVTRILEAAAHQVRLRHRRHAAAADRGRAGRLRPVRHALRDGHARPAERPQHGRVPRHPRPAEDPDRQRPADPQQGRDATSASTSTRSPSCSRRASQSVLPYAKEVSRSINLGMPVIAFAPALRDQPRLNAGLIPVLPEAAPAACRERGNGQGAPRASSPACSAPSCTRPSRKGGDREAVREAGRPRGRGAGPGRSRAARPTRSPGRSRPPGPRRPRTAPRRPAPGGRSKRKVRELVLAEVAPKMRRPRRRALAAEVKAALDRILQREDVKVSPSSGASSSRRSSRTPSATARSTRCWPTRPSPRSCATPTTTSGSSATAASSTPTPPSPTTPSTAR